MRRSNTLSPDPRLTWRAQKVPGDWSPGGHLKKPDDKKNATRASVDQLAQRFGVLPETVLGWRNAALESISAALLPCDGSTEREWALEKKVHALEAAFNQVTIEGALAVKAVEKRKTQTRPSQPTRSRRCSCRPTWARRP